MHRILQKSPTWHAVVWIILYVVTMGVGGGASSALGREHLVTAPAVLGLSALALLYLHHHRLRAFYGVTRVYPSRWPATLWFIPLGLMATVQLFKGLNLQLASVDVLLVVLLMGGVGFLEELLFRGFLYRALRERSGVGRAVLVSGLTFGLGHIANLLGGYTGPQQVLQVVVAIGLGVALALLFELTGSILPCVLFHILLNVSGSVTAEDPRRELATATAVMVIAVAYSTWLWVQLRRRSATEPSPLAQPTTADAPSGSRAPFTSAST